MLLTVYCLAGLGFRRRMNIVDLIERGRCIPGFFPSTIGAVCGKRGMKKINNIGSKHESPREGDDSDKTPCALSAMKKAT